MTGLARSLPALAVALAAMFFAIAAYINIVEQPARLVLGDAPLLQQWKLSYGMAIYLQATLAIVAGLAGIAQWWLQRDWRWLLGGLLMLANWPWTLAVVAPVNAVLMATGPEAAGAVSRALIERWADLHAARTGLGLAATILFLWACSCGPPIAARRPAA